MARIDEEERRRRKEAEAARNRRLMPNLTDLVAYVRDELKAQGVSTKTMKLVYGRDNNTGIEIGTAGAIEIHALDLAPRRVK